MTWMTWMTWQARRGRKRVSMPADVGDVALCLYACVYARISKTCNLQVLEKIKISRTIPPHVCRVTHVRPCYSCFTADVGSFLHPRLPRLDNYLIFHLKKIDVEITGENHER